MDPLKKICAFIAEEVKEILPESVDDSTEQLIPNIYKLGRIVGDISTIDEDLELNIEYNICVKNGEDLKNATKEYKIAVEGVGVGIYRINKLMMKEEMYLYMVLW